MSKLAYYYVFDNLAAPTCSSICAFVTMIFLCKQNSNVITKCKNAQLANV